MTSKLTPSMRMYSPSALRPENSLSLVSDPMTATSRALDLVLGIIEAPLNQDQSADVEGIGVFAVDAHGVRAVVELHDRVFVATGRDVGDLRDIGREQVDVVKGKANLRSRFLPPACMVDRPGNTIKSLVPNSAKMLTMARPKPSP